VNQHKLLKAIYQTIQWDRLYEIMPDATRTDVDELLRRLAKSLPPAPDSAGSEAEGQAIKKVSGKSAVLYVDGASSGNPGPAGIGMRITTLGGEEVFSWGESIGKATNNIAEYRALIAGLQKAYDLEVRSIRCFSDSELVVKQIQGKYRVKAPALGPLHGQVMDLLKRFTDWQIKHIPREQNRQADKLASRHAKKDK